MSRVPLIAEEHRPEQGSLAKYFGVIRVGHVQTNFDILFCVCRHSLVAFSRRPRRVSPNLASRPEDLHEPI